MRGLERLRVFLKSQQLSEEKVYILFIDGFTPVLQMIWPGRGQDKRQQVRGSVW